MNGLLVVDLDGTLVDVNSFTSFVTYLVVQMAKYGKWNAFFKVIHIVGLRKMRCISHADAKKAIIDCCNSVYGGNKQIYSEFCEGLGKRLRPSVINIIDKYRRTGATVALATAAPAEYAELFAHSCGFDYCIASGFGKSGESSRTYECKGDEKLRRVKELCLRENIEIAAVITDHEDDLPLLTIAPECYLVNPSLTTENAVRKKGIRYLRIN
ncbi:MAG: haloacid dehalogenase-like hydrolase [Bacteroidales bacterium]|nr:haloacid dehalogenase-like hydrolase [Bacteroidales bacterium]